MNKPIYIYITPFFPSPESWRGGYCLDAVKAINKDGRYDVRVMVEGEGDDYEWDGVPVSRIRRVAAPCGVSPFVFERCNNRLFLRKLEAMGIHPGDVAVCHANILAFGHYAVFVKQLNPGAKAVVQMHESYGLRLDSGRLGVIPVHATMLYLYYRRICASVDVLAFVSEMSRKTFGKRYVGTPEGEVRDVRSSLLLSRVLPPLKMPKQIVVYNGIDKSLFFPRGKERHEGFVIGCVANFDPLKDQITLIKAAELLRERVPNLKVRFVGSGETLAECKEYVRQHGLAELVVFEREMDHGEMPDFYRGLDLFVLPSRLEGFLCVCVECWACGTPAMFCEGTALPELVPDDEKPKWLFRPMDFEDLAAKIMSFYTSPGEQHFLRDLEINSIWREFLDRLHDW